MDFKEQRLLSLEKLKLLPLSLLTVHILWPPLSGLIVLFAYLEDIEGTLSSILLVFFLRKKNSDSNYRNVLFKP